MTHELVAIPRHRWIRIAPPHWGSVASGCAEPELRSTLAGWLREGQPLVSRARQPGEPPHLHPVGLCLPRSRAASRRAALAVAAGAIEAVSEPVSLQETCAILPSGAAAIAVEISQGAHALGFEARAFGSAAWQVRTGEAYLHSASDLDLLGAPPDVDALDRWLELLVELDARSPMRLDGEVEAPDGSATNWRELAAAPRQVLVKDSAGARLEPSASFRARFS